MNVKSITQIIKNQHHNPIHIHNGKNNVAVAALNVRRVKAQVTTTTHPSKKKAKEKNSISNFAISNSTLLLH